MTMIDSREIFDKMKFHNEYEINNKIIKNIFEFPVNAFGWNYKIFIWKKPEKKINIYLQCHNLPTAPCFDKFTVKDRDALLRHYTNIILDKMF